MSLQIGWPLLGSNVEVSCQLNHSSTTSETSKVPQKCQRLGEVQFPGFPVSTSIVAAFGSTTLQPPKAMSNLHCMSPDHCSVIALENAIVLLENGFPIMNDYDP